MQARTHSVFVSLTGMHVSKLSAPPGCASRFSPHPFSVPQLQTTRDSSRRFIIYAPDIHGVCPGGVLGIAKLEHVVGLGDEKELGGIGRRYWEVDGYGEGYDGDAKCWFDV